ncbi:hypothetical protein AYJ54_25745 [Bradyrhizobium centrolobii]|uniref:Uncharacterized protein n=3 Tax=Nitrobacteraceae TaxID=41294 RepID=A0A176YRP0_9BRAD|nr:hypothetical protein AYJ54_25745 [Bradyrhizobium centrolobii]OAF10351.1 hypothetical protein AXW67_25770 [Bradyrhizobium neotropicale]
MVMNKEARLNDDIGIATGAFWDFTKRAIGTQTEFSKRFFDIYSHWQERIQTESTQAMELFGKVNSTRSATDQIGFLQVWMKGATQRAAQDVVYSIETAKVLANVELPLFANPELFKPTGLFPTLGSLNLPAGAGINFHYGSWQLPTLRIEGYRPER